MRKEIFVTIDTDGRDKGKQFYIREMSARGLERWAARAIIALQNAGISVPEKLGIAGIAGIGLEKIMRIEFADFEPLMDEMLACVSAIPPSGDRNIKIALGFEGDIEDVTTLLTLRGEVIKIHMDFSAADVLSKLTSAVSEPEQPSPTTPTSPPQ